MTVEFTCKICSHKHSAIPGGAYDDGVPRMPHTITTRKNKNNHWYFCCNQCFENQGDKE